MSVRQSLLYAVDDDLLRLAAVIHFIHRLFKSITDPPSTPSHLGSNSSFLAEAVPLQYP